MGGICNHWLVAELPLKAAYKFGSRLPADLLLRGGKMLERRIATPPPNKTIVCRSLFLRAADELPWTAGWACAERSARDIPTHRIRLFVAPVMQEDFIYVP